MDGVDLPLYDESMPATMGQYEHEHTRRWNAKIAEFDGYIFVTAEYNHAAAAPLTNALAYPYNEWVNKGAAFVGYGAHHNPGCSRGLNPPVSRRARAM